MLSRRELLLSKSQPVQRWQHPAQTLRSATRCSGTSPTRWTTQSSVTKLNPKARSLTGCGRTGLFARRAKTSSTTSSQSLVELSGATMQLPSWMTGLQKQTRVEWGVARASRAELNQLKQRGGAKQSRTSSKLPSSFNAETETKPLCNMYYSSLPKILIYWCDQRTESEQIYLLLCIHCFSLLFWTTWTTLAEDDVLYG